MPLFMGYFESFLVPLFLGLIVFRFFPAWLQYLLLEMSLDDGTMGWAEIILREDQENRAGDEDVSHVLDISAVIDLYPMWLLNYSKEEPRNIGNPEKPYRTGALKQWTKMSPCFVCWISSSAAPRSKLCPTRTSHHRGQQLCHLGVHVLRVSVVISVHWGWAEIRNLMGQEDVAPTPRTPTPRARISSK